MRKRLLQDIVIPAGTIFEDAPVRTTRIPGHVDTVIALTKNTAGFVTFYCGEDEREELREWFEDAK